MRAIIQSIHSQVPRTIRNLGRRFDLIISMDSHLDVSLGGDAELYPKELRAIAARTGTHAAIRNMTGGLESLKEGRPGKHFQPRLIVAIPHLMLAKHAIDIESKLPSFTEASRPKEIDRIGSRIPRGNDGDRRGRGCGPGVLQEQRLRLGLTPRLEFQMTKAGKQVDRVVQVYLET